MDRSEYVLIVPAVPPSENHYRGRRKDGGEYRKLAAQRYDLVVQAEWANRHGETIRAGAYAIDLLFQFGPSHRTHEPDVTNLVKVAVDALQHCGAITNDKLVTDCSQHKRWGEYDQTTYTIAALLK